MAASATPPHSGVDAGEVVPQVSSQQHFWGLTLGSVGVVYGDIGTSPIYAFREAVTAAAAAGPVTRGLVLGVMVATYHLVKETC